MEQKTRRIATLAGVAAGGLAYWFQPYNQMTLLGVNILVIMGIGAFLGALVILFFLTGKPSKIALMVVLGVIMAVFGRILFDTLFWDSTSHNLAPFEILIAIFVSVPSALAGSYLGLLLKKFLK